jgi:hypothetical protein
VLEKQYGNLGYWMAEDDQAVWSVDVKQPGKYEVWFDWACDNGKAGNAYILQAGFERLAGKVQGTGTWDDYRQAKVGEIRLQSGRQQVLIRSAGRIRGAMIDLREVKLVPVAKK